MFGKNRTAPVPARGKHSLSLKPEKVSEPLELFIPDNAGRVRISDEVLDSIVDQVEERILKRSKGKQPHVKTQPMNLLDAVNKLLELNKQGVSAHLKGNMSGIQIRLNKDYPTTLPLEIWGTKLNDPSTWENLGMWNPTINEWQSQSWQVNKPN
ncbi:hypothetical protein [Lactiplantibacillus plantarum]|uniref:hypothetical protein n=1 Tax=Lactiplantibacillus plantarum TaxID=1590 RepID=UPI00325F01E5